MAAAAVGLVGSLGGALISSRASKSASKTAANAANQAADSVRVATGEARSDILNRMVPALKDYGNEIDNLQQSIAEGTVDVMNILQQATGNAMQALSTTGANARKAILGSAATSQGMPISQFEQRYSQAQSLPPAQQDQFFAQAFPNNAYSATTMRSDSGDRSTGMTKEGVPATPASRVTTGGEIPEGYRGTKQDLDRGYSPFEGRPGYNTNAALLERTPTTTTFTPGTAAQNPQYEYSPYQDRGTPGFNVNMAQNASGQYVQDQNAAPGTGFYGAMDQLNQGQQQGLGMLAQGTGQARNDIMQSTNSALGRLEPYSSTGREAQNMEAALSGALGPEAQQEAINNYIESPGQAYLREQQESALLRNASAIGGLGGGRVRTALQEQAFGIAATQQQSHLENLRSLAGRGQEADTTGAGIISNAGTQMAQLAEALGVRGSNLVSLNSQQKAQLAEQAGLSLAQLEQYIGAAQAGQLGALGGQQASALAGGVSDIASLGERAAGAQLSGNQQISTLLANLATQTGTNVAQTQLAGGGALAAGQAQAGATMGQAVSDIGNLAAYSLANRAAATAPVIPNAYSYGGNPNTDLVGANNGLYGMSR